MGLFDKLFGHENKDYKESSDLMTEDQFWLIIELAYRHANGDFEEQQHKLRTELKKLPLQDIISFDNRFRQLRGEAYDWQLWAAIYVIHGGCGDDSFIDFRDWIIAQGKEFYHKTISDPETLVEIETARIEVEWEGMGYIASLVFEELTGKDIPSTFRENQEVKGAEWSEENDELKIMFPRLWAKYSGSL